MDYKKTVLKRDFTISDVISIHYFEYAVDFTFSGEIHDFWEFVYADKKELVITSDSNEIKLPQGCLYLHKPMEFHNVRGDGVNAPNSVIVGFSSACPALYDIAGRVLTCTDSEKALMAGVIEEAREAFSTPLGDPYTKELIRKKDSLFGSEDLIAARLEAIFISLIRRYSKNTATAKPDRDTHRAESPLRQAEDAVVVDNSHMTPDEQMRVIYDLFDKACK